MIVVRIGTYRSIPLCQSFRSYFILLFVYEVFTTSQLLIKGLHVPTTSCGSYFEVQLSALVYCSNIQLVLKRRARREVTQPALIKLLLDIGQG